ncbi:testis-specific serine/threonine-protein kinase 2-like [Diachasma alloeum]|uniref:testis-specific serine/threonine-protein kinase 2-like n=1 Tax=Diachasma alloeum TaxID=454923 RepID=UPI0007381B5C|nr:testis-specific serine/threonine-protein kinase 2-like [Diachasma alloeum]
MSQLELNQTPSEELTLRARGYKILRKLGEGSFAKVFLAEYTPSNEPEQSNPLACKIVDTSKAPKDFVKKFLPRELDILAKLNHPHVVHVHSIFQRRCRYFIFMRFAENGDLLDFTLKNGAVDEGQARVWFRQLSLGLQYLHEMEIVHRDIKCENVLLTANNNVKLTDFGFARYIIDSRGKRVLSDTFCGSLMYAAPEILRGAPYNPKAADMWSLGVILYIILNKAMPFDEPNLKKLYEIQTNRRWKFRKKVADSLSEQVKKLVTNLLEPEVTKRWTADQIIHDSWIAMDPRLVVMTPAEQAALNNAIEDRKKNEEKFRRQSLHRDDQYPQKKESIGEGSKVEEVTVLRDSRKKTLSASAIDNRSLPRTSDMNHLGSIIG